jgi:transcriptional regulator with XRE-family HTH domain
MNFATIARIEQGQFASPGPDKLARIAEAIGLDTANVLDLAGYPIPELPAFQPYLRSKYQGLPKEAFEDINKAFERIIKKHGYEPDGPQHGEDEKP